MGVEYERTNEEFVVNIDGIKRGDSSSSNTLQEREAGLRGTK